MRKKGFWPGASKGGELACAHGPEKHVLDMIGDGDRFSDKIMRKQSARNFGLSL
jgi:hypothetical protein